MEVVQGAAVVSITKCIAFDTLTRKLTVWRFVVRAKSP